MVNKEDKEKILFLHWSKIPLIKAMPEETYKEFEQASRDQIVEVLRKGTEDEDPETKVKTHRHAMSVKEIQDAIELVYGSKKTKQNVYFHVNKLVELGFIQEVTIIKHGNHNITYYGRTAKLFLFNDKKGEVWKEKFDQIVFPMLSKVVNAIQGKDISEDVKKILQDKMDQNKAIMDKIDAWIEENSEILVELDTDIKLLYELITDFTQISTENINLNKTLLDFLKFNN